MDEPIHLHSQDHTAELQSKTLELQSIIEKQVCRFFLILFGSQFSVCSGKVPLNVCSKIFKRLENDLDTQ